MTVVRAHDLHFDIDCVVLDKDGTLLDFDYTWGSRVAGWIQSLATVVEANHDFCELFSQAIGYDWANRRIIADSPLAVTTGDKLATLAAGILYQHGIPWHEAERLAPESLRREMSAPFEAVDLRTVGDVPGAIRRLRAAGLSVAVVTGDDRASTESILALLGINADIGITICGDDPIADKPNPAALFHISKLTGIPTSRMVMVGDTANDMLTGRNAGAAGCIGIAGSTGDPTRLAEHADVILASIDQLTIASSANGHRV